MIFLNSYIPDVYADMMEDTGFPERPVFMFGNAVGKSLSKWLIFWETFTILSRLVKIIACGTKISP